MFKNITNATENVDISGVIYTSLSGYGITWGYFIVQISLFVVACVGIIFNIFAIYALKENASTLTEISRHLISNLACGDMLNDIVCIYTVLYNLIHYKNYYECAFRCGLSVGMYINTVLHILGLTFDRYFRIVFPYQYVNVITEKILKQYSRCVWIAAGALSIVPIAAWRKPPQHGIAYCSFFGVMSDDFLKLLICIGMSACAFALFCYFSILTVAWRQSRRVLHLAESHAIWWGPTKTVLILVMFYCCCWTPMASCIFLHLVGGFPSSYTDNEKGTVLAYCSSLIFIHTVGNPVIYAVKIKTVKTKIKSILMCYSGSEFRRNIRRLFPRVHPATEETTL